jgi:hypothetical protein
VRKNPEFVEKRDNKFTDSARASVHAARVGQTLVGQTSGALGVWMTDFDADEPVDLAATRSGDPRAPRRLSLPTGLPC